MVKEKRIKGLLYILLFIQLFIVSEVKALTFDDFEVTWYYRNKGNESKLLNVIKQEDVPLYASTSEYVNGYTTRVEQTFTKQIQYIVNYQLEMWFSPEQELNYRSDTIQRIIDYSYVDSDFKILNVVANETWNRSSGTGDTILKINVSMQVLALNNTNAIRFGVYTNNNISIGFYNHTDTINYYLVNNISVEENANATIIDQNNQIINGQNNLQNSITNTQDSINSNINDMEQSIVDSNKETQDVIKDQFNSCKKGNNILNNITWINGSYINSENNIINSQSWKHTDYIDISDYEGNYIYKNDIVGSSPKTILYDENKNVIQVLSVNNTTTYSLQKYNAKYIRISTTLVGKPELYVEEICSNRLDEQNDKLEGIQGALTDSSSPNTEALENSAGWLPAGPLDSILNLPLTMLNSLTNSLSKTCAPLNLTLPYVNKKIQIPCLSAIFAQITGVNELWTWIGTIASVLILYNYLLNLYAWVDRVLTLRAEFDEAMGADLANWGRL